MSFANHLKRAIEVIGLPEGEFCVFGGASLAIRGIRQTEDIDLYVTPKLYADLRKRGWKEAFIKEGLSCLTARVEGFEFEACMSYGRHDTWTPNIQEYIHHPEVVNGIPFMPLKELYDWKADTRRPKDILDLQLINDYWKTGKK